MSWSDDQIAALVTRVDALEATVRNMKALAKGDPGRDGKDGRDGRDGKSVSAKHVVSAIRAAGSGHRAPHVNLDAHIQIPPGGFVMRAPDVHVSAPQVHVAAPEVHLEAVIHTPAPTINVTAEAKAPIVNIKQDPAQVFVTLPARKTVSEIERDAVGNMTRVTQIEKDA